MKKLPKGQMDARDTIVYTLRETAGTVTAAFATVEDAVSVYNAKVDELNACLADAREFIGTIVDAMNDHYSERSEKWQESEAGSEYTEWRDEWDGLGTEDLEHIEVNGPDEFSTADDLEGLPTEPG